MKNYEKYADEIKGYKGDSICADFVEPYILKSINAKCTDTSCVKCHLYRTIWLMEEYKEPEEPEIDWNNVKVDTPILVRVKEDGDWIKRHFAKYENGLVYAWKDSHTSWTSLHDDDMTAWNFAKLAESEEEKNESKTNN